MGLLFSARGVSEDSPRFRAQVVANRRDWLASLFPVAVLLRPVVLPLRWLTVAID